MFFFSGSQKNCKVRWFWGVCLHKYWICEKRTALCSHQAAHSLNLRGVKFSKKPSYWENLNGKKMWANFDWYTASMNLSWLCLCKCLEAVAQLYLLNEIASVTTKCIPTCRLQRHHGGSWSWMTRCPTTAHSVISESHTIGSCLGVWGFCCHYVWTNATTVALHSFLPLVLARAF